MLVIDMATLTGAAEAITSHFGIAMTQDAEEEWVDLVKESGDAVYERILELPFWREYDELLKSTIADMSNLGGPKGGAITAGKFLHHFTDYDWIHLDIAGPAYLDAAKDYRAVGGTGAGVRLAYAIAKSMVG
jgi:leucyl aminopeptidase